MLQPAHTRSLQSGKPLPLSLSLSHPHRSPARVHAAGHYNISSPSPRLPVLVHAAGPLGSPTPPPQPPAPDAEQTTLRASSGYQKAISFIAFWLQLALSIVSCLILVFSTAFAPRVSAVVVRKCRVGEGTQVYYRIQFNLHFI